MLTKGQTRKYADVIYWALETARGRRFRANEVVLIRFDQAASHLAEVLQANLLARGMNPTLRHGLTPAMEHNFYHKSGKRQLKFVGDWERVLCENLNGGIYLRAPESLTHLSDVDPGKIGQAAVARKPLRDILRQREDERKFAWTLCMMPTEALAKHAGLTMRQYIGQVVRACYLDKTDPVRSWKKVYRDAMTVKQWLNSMDVRYYHVVSDHVDLKIRPGKSRRWIGISGHNIPSFEIFLSPDWRGTEGVYFADQPSFRSGNLVRGVKLTFERGVVKEVRAQKGKPFVKQQLQMDKGASRVGEFSLTDIRFSRINRFMANTLYDENYGGRYGNCHLAVGASYSDTYAGDPSELTKSLKARLGFNDSALHWDLVNTERKRVTAHLKDGSKVVVYEDGKFQY